MGSFQSIKQSPFISCPRTVWRAPPDWRRASARCLTNTRGRAAGEGCRRISRSGALQFEERTWRMSKRVLITGGAGFVGSHVADELLAHGYRVRALDVLSP